MSYEPSPTPAQQPPPGTRPKGLVRQVLGIVIAALGALAILGRFSSAHDLSAGDPLPGGILFIAVGAGLWWWGHAARKSGHTRPTLRVRASAVQDGVSGAAADRAAARQERRERAAAERAERARLAAAERAERERQAAAERERRETERQEAERKAEEERRLAAERAERERLECEAQQAERERLQREERLRNGYMSGTDWIPPRPRGAEVDPWGPARERVDIAGLNYRPEALKLAARREGYRKGANAVTLYVAITLVPDTHNPYGQGRAVAAYLNGEHTGYLAQEDADRFHHHLVDLAKEGLVLRVPGRGWVGDWAEYLSVRLPDPYTIRPSNRIPEEPHVIIPRGRTVQVTEEEQHMDVLTDYAPRSSGGENHVAVTLKSINRIMPRSAYPAVSVLLDGQEVGVLTKGQSAKLLPLVKHIEERDLLPVAHGVVKGTRLAVEVTLSTIMAADADDDWLDAMGPATGAANIDQTPAAPARPDFDWDDEDPADGE